MDVAVVLDESDYVCKFDPDKTMGAFSIETCRNFKNVQEFAVDIVKYYDIEEVNIAMLKFADQTAKIFGLNRLVT